MSNFGVMLMNSEKDINGLISRLELLKGSEKPYTWAAKIGITQATFNRMWKEGLPPKADTLLLISEKSGCSIDWLLTGKGEMMTADAGYHLAEDFKMASSAKVNAEGYHLKAKISPQTLPSIDDLSILLRDIIETYERMRSDRPAERKAREISLIFTHFVEHFAKHHDNIEIKEYIEAWF